MRRAPTFNIHSTFNVEVGRILRNQPRLRRRILGVGCCMFIVECFLVFSASAIVPSETFTLNPPHAEIPRSFLERYGTVCLIAAVFAVWIVGTIWLVLRSRTRHSDPIEAMTRRELELLTRQPETGTSLSHLSRTLRSYLVGAFDLPSEETTTAEFCRALAPNEWLGPELAESFSEFFRQTDAIKFAPDATNAGGNTQGALELFEAAERRRVELRIASTRKPPIYA
jgi:hypothetical protein